MATVNIGNIKFNWKGPWSNATTYAVDDVVSLSGSSYISIQAGSNQNPASASAYWQQMSAAGTDGTDVGATLANKEIAFKTNAGAVDGIPIGTAGQFLKVNSGATGYEYGAVSSDCVKLASHTTSSSVQSVDMDITFDDSIYSHYELTYYAVCASDTSLRMRIRQGGSTQTGANYTYVIDYAYRTLGGSGTGSWGGNSGNNEMRFMDWNHPDDKPEIGKMFFAKMQDTTVYKSFNGQAGFERQSGGTSYLPGGSTTTGTFIGNKNAITGFHFFNNSNVNFTTGSTFVCYGYKK